MSGTPLLKHDTLFKLGQLSGEMQSLILSVLLQRGGGERGLEKRERKGGLTEEEESVTRGISIRKVYGERRKMGR